jgi:cytochrome c-type biogenesis protein CcmH/NrfG
MTVANPRRRPLWLAAVVIVLTLLAGGGFVLWRSRQLPEPGSERYERYVRLFQVGEAAADTDQPDLARTRLTEAIDLVPQEPAGYADRGLLELRLNQLDPAARDLGEAIRLAPGNAEIEAMLGHLDRARGRFADAAGHFHKSLESRPDDLAVLYALARTVEQQGGAHADTEYQRLIERGLKLRPTNLRLLRDRASVAIRRGDRAALADTLASYGRLSARWDKEAVAALDKLKEKAAGPIDEGLVSDLDLLDNLLKAEPGYVRSVQAVDPDQKAVGEMMSGFVRLAPARPTPAPADFALSYGPAVPIGDVCGDVVLPVWLDPQGTPAIFVADAKEVRRTDADGLALPFPGGPKAVPPTADGVIAFDWNNDQRPDLLLAGAGGLRFFQGGENGTFTDVTARTTLPADVLNDDYYGVWATDFEADGDLDVIAAPRAGPVRVLRNNGDGTWKVLQPFAGVSDVRAFVRADFDNDGAPDAAFLDSKGQLFVFANERMGLFQARPLPSDLPAATRFLALAAADTKSDGALDLIALAADRSVLRFADRDKGQSWDVTTVAHWEGSPDALAPGVPRLFAADLDNNGAIDLLASGPDGSFAWLGSGGGHFAEVQNKTLPPNVFAVADCTGTGHLDLLAIDKENRAVRYSPAASASHYRSIVVRPRAAPGVPRGDSRINSFGVGGTVQVRTGRLVQTASIMGPVVQLGIGENTEAQVVRIDWPNGTFQVEFEVPSGKPIIADQRLKGSCPFLFADDGSGVKFVTDFLWSTPLGMYINGQDKGGFLQTTDWVKVRADQLAERDGFYDLRVNANLWETHYIDWVAFKVVDHPPDTEIYVDERFAITPIQPQVYVTAPPRPVPHAVDDEGRDVTEVVSKVDGRYLDTFGLGTFQGLTRDHWVEVDLGPDVPTDGPFYLLATGWIHPTDSSLNVAISQGHITPPTPLMLEVPDDSGNWKAVGPPLGFPAGKNKTMVLRLDGVAGRGVPRRMRLRTNMEIYWDALATARGLDPSLAKVHDVLPESADLRYRGIVQMTRANASSPEIPNYDKVIGRRQYWRDLIGYYTRFGDVRELLAKVDDRYAILNAGDELAFRFRAPPAPPAGWKRDFVWISDGWVKDGDFNTRFSKTVLPLPAHDQTSYSTPPGRLQDDPVYRRHADDWRRFHTRWVTPSEFERGLHPTTGVRSRTKSDSQNN